MNKAKQTRKFIQKVKAVKLLGDPDRYFISYVYLKEIKKAVKKGLINFQKDFYTGESIDRPQEHVIHAAFGSYTSYGLVVTTLNLSGWFENEKGSFEYEVAVGPW